MSRSIPFSTPARLAALVVLVAAIPLLVLGWIGSWSLRQERDLEEQRRTKSLQQTAALLARDLDGVVPQWRAMAVENPTALVKTIGDTATVVILGPDGAWTSHGAPLLYYPPRLEQELDDERLRSAERAELVAKDLDAAIAGYRRAVQNTNQSVRAAALVGLARCLTRQGKASDALATYQQLAELGGVSVFGFPAEIVARRERAALFSKRQRRADAAAELSLVRERLMARAYRLDRATFNMLTASVPDVPVPAGARAAAEALETAAREWTSQPNGVAFAGSADSATATVWRPSPHGVVAVVAPLSVLLANVRQSASELGVTLAVVAADGRVLFGEMPAATEYSATPLDELGMAATLRVALTVPPANPLITRERLFLAAFGLLTAVIGASAYVVYRSIRRQLGVAQLQSEFVATVSHEFRSPLTAMRHLTETLEEGGASAERLPEYYRALSKETRRLQSTVETVLDFGRLDAGRRTYVLAPLDATQAAHDVVVDARATALGHAREISLSGTEAPAVVLADHDALVLALRNLVDNALKYSEAPAPVRVEVGGTIDTVTIAVSDRGAGMTQAEQGEVFRKFVRGSAAGALNVKGTGLGLAIVDRVIAAHRGRVSVESVLGAGSTFTVVLPRAVGHVALAPEAAG